MFEALKTILKDNWKWRKQIRRLAIFELIKQSRGAVLGWVWIIIKPTLYVLILWFALDIGLRAGGTDSYPPYFLWLLSGMIPWFYMRDMLGKGSDILHHFSFLVGKIRFPLSGISTIFSLSSFVVHIVMMLIVFIIYILFKMPIDLYILQIPVFMLFMFVFFNMFSILTSQISAISKDFSLLLKSLVTPLFWLSGIIFNIDKLDIVWIKTVLLFNPVTFFAYSYRNALFNKSWFWENMSSLGGFALVFFVTLIVMLFVYKHLHKEVSDAF